MFESKEEDIVKFASQANIFTNTLSNLLSMGILNVKTRIVQVYQKDKTILYVLYMYTISLLHEFMIYCFNWCAFMQNRCSSKACVQQDH